MKKLDCLFGCLATFLFVVMFVISCGGGGPVVAETVAPELSPVGDTIYNSEVPVMSEVENASFSPALKWKVINIGGWDMDTTDGVLIPHGLLESQIQSVTGWYWSDLTAYKKPIGNNPMTAWNDGLQDVFIHSWDDDNVAIYRKTGGGVDGVNFNDDGINRGSIVIGYVE